MQFIIIVENYCHLFAFITISVAKERRANAKV